MGEVDWYRVDFSIKLRAINKEHAVDSAVQCLNTQAVRRNHIDKVVKVRKVVKG